MKRRQIHHILRHRPVSMQVRGWKSAPVDWHLPRLLCIGHLEMWRPMGLHPRAPLKITSNRQCQENCERVSAQEIVEQNRATENLKTMFFSISMSDNKKKRREKHVHGEEVFSSLFLPLATRHGWSVNVKVLREWRVSLCACVNYTCTASALSAAASKRNNFFRQQTTSTVEC